MTSHDHSHKRSDATAGEVDQLVELLESAAQLNRTTRSAERSRRMREVRAMLVPLAGSRKLRTVDEALGGKLEGP
jgi:hypothetical protein